ncbi:MAG TPA: TonB-dependent receptor [Bacteroidia bacterium]|jgi:outer membrane cobalamin receptor|nr:TonB-dependent receptor [Bacteroidia bacterium]
MLKVRTINKLYFLICFSFFISAPSLIKAQAILKGVVSDSATGEKLPGVVVSVDSTLNTLTDMDGRYELHVADGTHKMIVTFYSYYTISRTITCKSDTLNFNFILSPVGQVINQVVVSASMYGKNIANENISMEVLKAKTIENTGAVQVDEALNNVPGVNITADGQANIRGGSGWTYGAGSRVLVLVDGQPELTADAQDAIWDFLPIEQVQQVEVIKGASSVLYGSSALDGVINLRTTMPGPTPQTTINIFQSIYGNPNIDSVPWKAGAAPGYRGFTFMHSQQFGRLDLITSGDVYDETSYLQGAFSQRIRGSINARYRFKKIDGLMVGLRVNEMYNNESSFLAWANDTNGILRPLSLGSSTLVPGKFLRESIDPYINYFMPGGGKITLQGRYFVSNNEDYGNTDKGSRSQLRYSELTYQKAYKHHFTLTVGIVASGSEVAAQLYGNHTGTNFAGYAQLEKTLFKKLILTGGIRKETFKDDSSQANSPLVYRAGLNYALFKYTHFRASYGEGFRYPSIAEKYISTNIGGVLFIDPNPDIHPEKAFSSEIGINQGLKIGSWIASVDVAAFQTVFNNLIDFTFGYFYPNGQPAPHDFQYFGAQSENVETALIKGIEASFSSEGKIMGLQTTFMVDFTVIDPINVDTLKKVESYEASHPNLSGATLEALQNSEYLNYRSLYSGKAGFETTCHKFSFGANARYSSFQINIDNYLSQIVPGVIDFREKHNTGQCIFDTHIAYQATESIRIAFVVKNLLNTTYTDRPGYLDPPRTFMVQSTIKF